MHMPGTSKGGLVFFLLVQVGFLAIFAFFTEYESGLLPVKGNMTRAEPELVQKYPRKSFFSDKYQHLVFYNGFL